MTANRVGMTLVVAQARFNLFYRKGGLVTEERAQSCVALVGLWAVLVFGGLNDARSFWVDEVVGVNEDAFLEARLIQRIGSRFDVDELIRRLRDDEVR